MKKFSQIKNNYIKTLSNKILNESEDKKEIVNLLKEKDISSFYKFYNKLSTTKFDDELSAKIFLEEMVKLKPNTDNLISINKKTETILEDFDNVDTIDILIDFIVENDITLDNVKQITEVKRKLIMHLCEKNEEEELTSIDENILKASLLASFNTEFNIRLSEDEKNIFNQVIECKLNGTLNEKFNDLKSSVLQSLNESESNDIINETISNIESLDCSDINYCRLLELKNDL